MKKAISILLTSLLTTFVFTSAVSAQSALNVALDKESKTVSVSGTFDTQYANAIVGMYVTQQEDELPQFGAEGYSEIFITLQDTVSDNDGNFTFKDVNISNAEGNIKFSVAVLSDATYEELSKTIYVPTKEAVTNFFAVLNDAQSGADVLTLINADMENTEIDGKNVHIGLDKRVYEVYPQLDRVAVANMIYNEIKDGSVANVTQFDALHTQAALECAFLASATPEEVWAFINVDAANIYYEEITSALNLKKTKELSVVKKLADYDASLQAEVLANVGSCADMEAWIEGISVDILNREMSDATDSYVQKLLDDYSDVLTDMNYTKYDTLKGYHGDIASEVLDAAPYTSTKAICEVANKAIDTIAKKLKSESGSSSGSSSGGSSSKKKPSGGFSAQVAPVIQPAPAPQAKPAFDDIASVEWAAEAITSLNEKHIINGKEDRKFYPNDNITREEFVKILVLAFNAYSSDAVCSFEDVSSNDWFAPYVASAYKAGFVTGVSDVEFGVGIPVTRQDAATMIYRLIKADDADKGDLSAYTDRDEIALYAKDAVASLSKLGIVNGMSDAKFCPKNYCTRAQAAKMIYETLRR